MNVRQKLYESNGCNFEATVTADYADKTYEFSMDCSTESSGAVSFTVIAPETIAGVAGVISDDGGKLTFDDKVLLFEPLTDGRLSPAIAPWIMIRTLSGGYIKAASHGEIGTVITFDDIYMSENLQVEITFDSMQRPIYCEILWEGRRILSTRISNFTFK